MGTRRPAQPAAPAPQAPEPVQPAVKPPEGAPGTLLEQLQKSGHAGDRKARVSLRQTGLLRPVTEQDATVSVQNPDAWTSPTPDSAKESGNEMAGEGDELEHHDGERVQRN